MGANIKVEDRAAIFEGVDSLSGAPITATDLRAGAALIIAGLTANGVTEIDNISFIDRGYERIEEKLTALGADIKNHGIIDNNDDLKQRASEGKHTKLAQSFKL